MENSEIVKVCKKHGIITYEFIYIRKQKNQDGTLKKMCRICSRERGKKYIKKYSHNYYIKNKKKFANYIKNFHIKNPEYAKNRSLKMRKNLSDYYIGLLIRNNTKALRHKDIPASLIDAHRLNLALKRKLKENRNGN